MIRRPRRTVPAVLAALVLLAACIAVAVSLIQRLTGNNEYVSYDSAARQLHGLTWNDPLIAAAAVLALVLGALALLAAALPGRARVLPLDAGTAAGIDAGIHRRDLQAMVRTTANSVDGVHSARVRIRRATVTVLARTDLQHREGLAEAVCQAVSTRIQQVGRPVTRVTATVRGPGPTRDQRSRKVQRRFPDPGPGERPTAGAPLPRTGGM